MNNRVTAKERGLLKGALRRVFSRSELRQQALKRVLTEHNDPKRPRVKKWGYCEECGEVTAAYELTIDHKDPVIPPHTTFEEMGLDKTADRLWCDLANLQAICNTCHDAKTKRERKIRRKKK